uniref:Uncharacterized protein n=1 Tax=Oryza brachyantha TaxID=4533 RepID=J3LU87_ORYBR
MPERALHVKDTATDAPVATLPPALLLLLPQPCCSSAEAAKHLPALLGGLSELLAPLDQRAALDGVLLRHLDGAPDPEQQHLQPLQLLVRGRRRAQLPQHGGECPVSDLPDHRGGDGAHSLFCHLPPSRKLI